METSAPQEIDLAEGSPIAPTTETQVLAQRVLDAEVRESGIQTAPAFPEVKGNLDATNFYDILGVPKDVSATELKRVWRTLAWQNYPDLHIEDPNATAKFQKIQDAYDTLSDPAKRSRYDTDGSSVPPTDGTQLTEGTKLLPEEVQAKEKQLFEHLGVDSKSFPEVPESITEKLSELGDSKEPTLDDMLEPLTEEVQRKNLTIREVAGWMFLLSLDMTFNHGYGTQQVLDRLFKEKALAPFMKWMGADDKLIAEFINNPHDMAQALAQLDTPMLKQQLDQMSGNQIYEFMASMTPHERKDFQEKGQIISEYRTHEFSDAERDNIFKRLSEQQKSRLGLEKKV